MKSSFILRTFLIIAFVTFTAQTASAQISFPDNVDDEAPAAPIDTIIIIGLAAGTLLGLGKHKTDK